MNAQEIFDKVLTGLRKQGQQAMSNDTMTCMYRTPAGLKCAAGMLIDDADYDPEFENLNFVALLTSPMPTADAMAKRAHLKELFLPQEELIQSMQLAHDGYSPVKGPFVEYINKKFKEIANIFDLNYTE